MTANQTGYPQQDRRATVLASAILEVRGLRDDLARLHAEATHHRDQAQRASVAAREAMAALTAEQERTAALEREVRRLRLRAELAGAGIGSVTVTKVAVGEMEEVRADGAEGSGAW